MTTGAAAAILPLESAAATLELAGGKGLNLSRLARAGFAVPRGFLITTRAYDHFALIHGLRDFAPARARAAPPQDPDALEAASAEIRGRFREGRIPDELARSVREAYAALGAPPVAVRSSATAEDLPGMSFAGQQDTTLNVVEPEALLRALVDCWSSLWSARAIAYRARMGFAPERLSLAVIVQTLVPAEAAGVLFTANPLDGRRTEVVIDAALGLGEALVSGQLDPDHYVVAWDGSITTRKLGAKALSVQLLAGGGTRTQQEQARGRQALPDHAIRELAELGRHVADLYGEPQDIEWAWDGRALWLLQARPITALFPLPDGVGSEPLDVLISFGAVQGMLDPITPLGRDMLCGLAVGAAHVFGLEFTRATQPALRTAGERLFVDVTAAVRHPIGRRALRRALPLLEPAIARAMQPLWDDPRLEPIEPGSMLGATSHAAVALRVAPVGVRILARIAFSLIWPDWSRARLQARIERLVAKTRARAESARGLGERVALIEETLLRTFPTLILHALPRIASGMGALVGLRQLAGSLPEPPDVLMLMRGLANNVTTQMDLALWRVATQIRDDAATLSRFKSTDAAELARDWQAKRLPDAGQAAVGAFLERYGMRGIAEIDFGRPRWSEDPTPIMQVLQSYLEIDDPERAPDRVFARGADEAEVALEQLVQALRGTRAGWLKGHVARWAARRMRALAGLRESPKFLAVRLFGIARAGLLESGRELARAGTLARSDDLFYLSLDELAALAEGAERDWKEQVAERRRRLDRERGRRQIPRLLLGDGHAFYEGLEPGSDELLVGSPVSPGLVDGIVHVVLDPRTERLRPGEILVCPATDPGWTPLFLAAGGLVMEMGGLMTHGAVVAREYGIPAVVGVHQATRRLRSGQRIRVDGSSGRIELLDPASTRS